MDRVAREPLQFEPAANGRIGNSGIDTLGRIVEEVSGKKFEQYLADEIFTPLGMGNTSFFPNNPNGHCGDLRFQRWQARAGNRSDP